MINAKELIMYKDPSDHQIQPDVEIKTRVNNESANNNNNQVEGEECDESDCIFPCVVCSFRSLSAENIS
jgi:hypothetical protein